MQWWRNSGVGRCDSGGLRRNNEDYFTFVNWWRVVVVITISRLAHHVLDEISKPGDDDNGGSLKLVMVELQVWKYYDYGDFMKMKMKIELVYSMEMNMNLMEIKEIGDLKKIEEIFESEFVKMNMQKKWFEKE
ncbi:unnamed protein product [Vicia faba]|uniref:Uncharacterized protein n=1 Tax=Vicia faba TaxID=3906 RepID=A0AAV1AYH1_VICFA|nr:unnamed protein product [Vicia faba]